MAQGSGYREPPSVIAPKGEEDAEMSSEPGAFEMSAASLGKRRERRSGVLLAGTGTVAVERFASTLATDSDSGLLEAARATPRRSSIIKVRSDGFALH